VLSIKIITFKQIHTAYYSSPSLLIQTKQANREKKEIYFLMKKKMPKKKEYKGSKTGK